MINLKALIIKLLYFLTALLFLIVYAVLNNNGIVSPDSYTLNAVIAVLLIAASVVALHTHKEATSNGISIPDFIMGIFLVLFLALIYYIPMFGFYGVRGGNNTILVVYLFLSSSMYFRELSVFNAKKESPPTKALQTKEKRNAPRITIGFTGSLNRYAFRKGYTNYEKSFRTLARIFIVVGIGLAVFNTVYPIMDMSILFS